MQAVTFIRGRILSGIQLIEDDRLGLVVFLGEEGRGRRYEKVALFRKDPAEVVERMSISPSLPGGKFVENAHPVWITLNKGMSNERRFLTLANPASFDERVLVRINTVWSYTRNSEGRWETVKGSPETLVKGYGAHGDAGRIGSWDDGLVVLHPGDVVRIKPEGGHKSSAYALSLTHEGKLECMPFEAWEALSANQVDNSDIELV